MRLIKLYYIFLLSSLALSCSSNSVRPVTIRGSDTMVAIGQKWAEVYMLKFPLVTIQVNGGGSGTGIAALINRIADICQSSRTMKPREKKLIKDKFGTDVIEIPVCKDGIVIYVNESNPVNEISIDQLRQVYTGKITNWKQVGGEDIDMNIYGRENSSGTYEFFKKAILNGADFNDRVQTLPGTGAVANAISSDKKGIGYGGAAYSRGIKALAVKKSNDSIAVLADAESVSSGAYPIARDLYFYLTKEPKGTQKDFINWILSDEGQELAIAQGYFPIRKLNLKPDSLSAK